jgi:hypothetical protein
MKTATLVALGIAALPVALSAQRGPLPRGGRGILPPATLIPQSLPPQAPVVARALAVHRSRWSAEGYSLVSAFQVPAVGGGTTTSSSYGAGTHAGYRFTDRLSATVDLTTSPFASSTATQTVELGTRYSPFAFDQKLRPFFDVRAAYLRMSDSFAALDGSSIPGGSAVQFGQTGAQYSRGFGAVAGVGFEYSLTRSFSLTNEVSILRDRQDTYRITGQPEASLQRNYWMTSARYAIGLKYSAVRALHAMQ